MKNRKFKTLLKIALASSIALITLVAAAWQVSISKHQT